MARPSLRKIDPNLDLSPWLLAPALLEAPLDAEAIFGRRAELEVEVGSGKGLFLTSAAAARPERDFLGIELARKYARFVAARLARASVSNARVLNTDARWVVAHWLSASSVAAVHVYFPDPWWKKRHRKRRLMDASFVRDVGRVLADGGRLHFWTDVEEYYRAALEALAAEPTLAGPFPVAPAEGSPPPDRTHFDRRSRLAGTPVWRAEFIKVPSPPPGEKGKFTFKS